MAGKKVKLSYQEGSGYKKCIGKYLGPDGKIRPKVFWFGADKSIAEQRAAEVFSRWTRLKSEGHLDWPPDVIAKIADDWKLVQPEVKQLPSSAAPVETGSAASSPMTLYNGMELYLAYLTAKAPHQLSQSHVIRARQIVRSFKTAFADVSLDAVSYDLLVLTAMRS